MSHGRPQYNTSSSKTEGSKTIATLNDNAIANILELWQSINTFLSANGWTVDEAAAGSASSGDAAYSRGDCHVQIGWDTTNHFDIHQSTSFTAPLVLGGEPGDSGFSSRVDIGAPVISLTQAEVWGYTNADTAAATDSYARFVVEFNRDGRYIHFGFGHLLKYNDWTGGAYKYGWTWATGTAAAQPWTGANRILLDSNHANTTEAQNLGTIRASGLVDQDAASNWLGVTNSNSSLGNDTDGDPVGRAEAYSRHGPWPILMLDFRGNPNNAFLPLIPVQIAIHRDSTSRRMLGEMRDVGVCNIGNIQPKQVITLGGDTYRFFPWGQKLTNGGSDVIASRNAGIWYREV